MSGFGEAGKKIPEIVFSLIPDQAPSVRPSVVSESGIVPPAPPIDKVLRAGSLCVWHS